MPVRRRQDYLDLRGHQRNPADRYRPGTRQILGLKTGLVAPEVFATIRAVSFGWRGL